MKAIHHVQTEITEDSFPIQGNGVTFSKVDNNIPGYIKATFSTAFNSIPATFANGIDSGKVGGFKNIVITFREVSTTEAVFQISQTNNQNTLTSFSFLAIGTGVTE